MPLEKKVDTLRSLERNERLIAVCEISSLVSTLLLGAWAIAAISNDHLLLPIPVAAGIVFIFLSMRIRGETSRGIGFRFDNFGKCCLSLAVPMAIASVVMVGIGFAFGSLRLATPEHKSYILWLPLAGIAWGTLQQFALQGFVNRRAQIIWGPGWKSCLLVAVLFAAFHMPNAGLSLATFAGGVIWSAVYQRYPNLYALGLSHSLMTFGLVCTIPEPALQGLGVGFRLWVP